MTSSTWPDIDRTLQLAFLVVVVGLPAIGYWLAFCDLRAYLRELKGVMVRVATPKRPPIPDWVRDETPPCVQAFGLSWPCSEDDLKVAYRKLAKELHPDRGGPVQRFLILQENMEQATHFVRQRRRR